MDNQPTKEDVRDFFDKEVLAKWGLMEGELFNLIVKSGEKYAAICCKPLEQEIEQLKKEKDFVWEQWNILTKEHEDLHKTWVEGLAKSAQILTEKNNEIERLKKLIDDAWVAAIDWTQDTSDFPMGNENFENYKKEKPNLQQFKTENQI
jgi:hypothetical protein